MTFMDDGLCLLGRRSILHRSLFLLFDETWLFFVFFQEQDFLLGQTLAMCQV